MKDEAKSKAQLVAELRPLRRLVSELGYYHGSPRDDGDRTREPLIVAPGAVIIRLAPDFRILDWNPVAEHVYGWKRHEVLDRNYAELFLPEEIRGAVAADLQKVLAGEATGEFECCVRARGGREKTLLWKVLRVPDPSGEAYSILTIGHDLTEHRRTEEELRKSEERYRAVSELSSDYAYGFQVSPDGNLDSEWVTEALTRLTGYTLEELKRRGGWEKLLHPEDVPLAKRQLEQLVAGNAGRIDYRIRTKSGEIRWMRDYARPVRDADGRLCQILGAVQDITDLVRAENERRELEARLHQAQKMESIGRLAGGIAHDFNNLLSPILGYAELGLANLPEADPLSQDLLVIKQAAERATALTRQLLAVSRKQVLELQVIDINDVISELHDMLRHLVREDIDIELQLAPDVGRVRADPSQIHQLGMNLVLNARDAMPNGGRLQIETANTTLTESTVTLTDLPSGPYVTLTVRDSGAGMPEEILSSVFDPFFTTKEPGRGTGLGLATVLGIANQHGGSVAVNSQPGRGSMFRVYLPRAEGEPKSLARAVSAAPDQRGTETVLVVEDDEMVRRLTREMLRRKGYRVLAPDGVERALELAGGHAGPVHLLITDIIMPGMNGRELYERARAARPELRVLFMSGYSDEATVAQVMANPGTPFLQKPFSLRDLTEKVRAVLDS